ncbi:hypothetical protein OJF2_37340 [Aquisphaera giovannonii]|uniref:Uncharacterized protein n=1 Tax=Aquisphaera giovannonii TaxID=406548 RepID=A0A5B9W4M4_9BACT|nr:hypothetical protein [Aquisphaera giovannonii]QEH35187.1 hypothetical protein OJF2_37340 [Aquisphaera giovannonii]
MLHPIRRIAAASPLVLLVAGLSLAGSPAHAQVVKPFKVVGGGVAEYLPVVPDVASRHFAVGQATELGRYYGEGAFQVLEFHADGTADFDSARPFVFVAANGDRLAFTYGDTSNGAARPGEVTLHPTREGLFVAVFVAEFNPIPALCTGRFAKVTGGSFIMTAVTQPFEFGAMDPVGYIWSGEGSLVYRRGH